MIVFLGFKNLFLFEIAHKNYFYIKLAPRALLYMLFFKEIKPKSFKMGRMDWSLMFSSKLVIYHLLVNRYNDKIVIFMKQ